MKKGKRLVALVMSVLLTVVCCFPTFANATIQPETMVQSEVLYEDDFSTDTKYIEALGSTKWQTCAQPIWDTDKLVSGDYTLATDAKLALLNGLGADSLSDYTVEADITADTSGDRNCYVSIYGRTTGDKTFGDSYRFSYRGKCQKFYLNRVATGASGNAKDLVMNVAIGDYFSDYNQGDAIRMSITAVTYSDYVNIICKVTYGGVTKEVINYKDTDDGRYTFGLPGFGLQQQNSSLDNVKVTLVTLKQLTEEDKYICLDNDSYSTSGTGIVLLNGKQQTNASALTQAGDYTVAVTADSLEVSGMVILYYQGDATGDKKADEQVDVKDLVRLKRGVEDETLFTKAGKKAANMNDDTNIDETDATLLRDKLVQ